MSIKRAYHRPTLWDAAKIYVVYLHALRITYLKRQAYLRALRHILMFYGYRFPLEQFDGKRVLQYAEIYDPFSSDWVVRERGQSFWLFIHWMKKNNMIPGWATEETVS